MCHDLHSITFLKAFDYAAVTGLSLSIDWLDLDTYRVAVCSCGKWEHGSTRGSELVRLASAHMHSSVAA